MYDKENIVLDILKDLNTITTVILSGQNGDKPPAPYAEVNIITEVVAHDFEEIEYISGATDVTTKYKNATELTLSITHHSKNNLDNEVNELADYFRSDIKQLEYKYDFSIISEPNISNRNTVLSVEFDNVKGFDVTLYVDDTIESVETYIEQVEI